MNSGMFHVPDSHPTPSASLSVFWGFFFGRSGLVLCLRGVARLACFVACMRKACITSHGGSEARHLTPPLGSSLQLSLRFLGFRCGAESRMAPLENAILISSHLPALLRQPLKARARMRRAGEQPYCHTNAWTMVLLKSRCLFGARCTRIF